MKLRLPDIQELTRRCERGTAILISAPFYSQEALDWVRPHPRGHVEFWTRFNPRDWAAGVSDPPALLRYLEGVGEDRVSLRVHRALHAKIYRVDAAWSWIGSPNLSRAAFTSNIELVAELDEEETESLGNMVDELRGRLRELPVSTLRAYIEACEDAIHRLEGSDTWQHDDFQAAVELADEYLSPASAVEPTAPMPPLSDFIDFIRPMVGDVPRTVLDHHHNLSGQNRQGHVKQSYYALVHFLSDRAEAQHLAECLALSLDDYPRFSASFANAWIRFLDDNARIKDGDLGYSFSTLRNVLPERIGGYVISGGGAIGTFTRMAPLVARFLFTFT